MSAYDEALFRQLLGKRRTTRGYVTHADIEEVFRVVAWDVYLAIEQQNPAAMDLVHECFQREFAPGLAATLTKRGGACGRNRRCV